MWKMVLIFVVGVFILSGCGSSERKQAGSEITREFLLARGFQQSLSDPDIFYLTNVRLKDAARNIGFSLGDLRPTPSQSLYSDVRVVKIRNLHFIVESKARDKQGRIVPGSLDNPDAICTISVSLHQVASEKNQK